MLIDVHVALHADELDLFTTFTQMVTTRRARRVDSSPQLDLFVDQPPTTSEGPESDDEISAQADAAYTRALERFAPPVVAPPTEAEMVQAVRDLVAQQGFAAAQALLAEFGAKRVGEVPSERREEFLARAGK